MRFCSIRTIKETVWQLLGFTNVMVHGIYNPASNSVHIDEYQWRTLFSCFLFTHVYHLIWSAQFSDIYNNRIPHIFFCSLHKYSHNWSLYLFNSVLLIHHSRKWIIDSRYSLPQILQNWTLECHLSNLNMVSKQK